MAQRIMSVRLNLKSVQSSKETLRRDKTRDGHGREREEEEEGKG